ncbi:hypothetical protein [Niastella koreensis]|nr:hypothetical protein [Niastella koreensis]
MKFLLLLVCSLSYGFLTAQDCKEHLLMQKGVQLEYSVHFPKLDSNGYKLVSRLLFEVNEVKDSAGGRWSSITKRGYSVAEEKKYERKIVLQCDGQHLLIPYDFYYYDTIFTKDIHKAGQVQDEFGYVIAFTPLTDAITYIVPLALDCVVGLTG